MLKTKIEKFIEILSNEFDKIEHEQGRIQVKTVFSVIALVGSGQIKLNRLELGEALRNTIVDDPLLIICLTECILRMGEAIQTMLKDEEVEIITREE